MDTIIRHTFQPDYTVRACTELLYLKVKRSLYLAAKKASLMELSQKDTVAATGEFDAEVEKVSYTTNSSRPQSIYFSTVFIFVNYLIFL